MSFKFSVIYFWYYIIIIIICIQSIIYIVDILKSTHSKNIGLRHKAYHKLY